MQLLISNSSKIISKIEDFKEICSDFSQNQSNLFQDRLKTSQSDSQSIDFQIGPSLFPSHQESSQSENNVLEKKMLKLAILTVFNKSKKALNTLSFNLIKQSAKRTQSNNCSAQNYDLFPSEQIDLQSFVEKTLSFGSILQNKTNETQNCKKQSYRRIFYLEAKISQQTQRINQLLNQIDEKQRILLKQAQKKRESLETFAQQVRQKSDYIFQLKNSIKQYEKMLGINHQRLSVQNVLVQDELELKRNCLRLQNINEKLNNDLKSSLQKIENLKIEVQQFKNTVLYLRKQNQLLKQTNFDLTHILQKDQQTKQIYTSLCQRLNKKIESIKLQQKNNNDKQIQFNKDKNSLIFSSEELFSSKKTSTSLSSIPLSRKSSLKDLESEQKIEEIFSFIFNIQSQNYKLNNQQLFDQDELKLLKSHRNFFLINAHNQNPQITQQEQIISLKNNKLNNDAIFCPQINKNSKLIESSFLSILDTESKLPSIKQLESDNSRLIEKISDLKKMHMHTRDLLLNLFKTIDFANMKNQTLKIVEVIFDFFQYSEDEKSQLIKEKRKKLWGII